MKHGIFFPPHYERTTIEETSTNGRFEEGEEGGEGEGEGEERI
jgi:hypothetical protein